MAAYRPQANDIALFVDDGDRHASVAVSLDEAKAIYGALGLALRLAGFREDPVGAVR